MSGYRYSGWDGKQSFPDLDKDTLLTELERTLTSVGDLSSALWKMQREGIEDGHGEHLPGNRELYQRLEEKRRQLLDKYDIAPVARALRHRLQAIDDLEKPAELPEDIAAQVEAWKRHRFTNTRAQQDMERLLKALDTGSLEPLGTGNGRPVGVQTGTRETPSLSEALALISLLQKLDRLESQLRANQRQHSLASVDPGLVAEVLGEDSATSIESLSRLESMLRNAGYVRDGATGPELTPRAIRKIGQKAIEEIYRRPERLGRGSHAQDFSGGGGMRMGETRKYEVGDDFNIHLLNTVMNSLRRAPRKPPLTLAPDDLETVETEAMTRAATVLMLDLSRSMHRHGNFQAAKRLAFALTELVRSRFPSDALETVGFSTYARRIQPEQLAAMSWDERNPNTNIQDALRLARKLLSQKRGCEKHIILITDGEPTAHIEDDRVYSKYPPTPRTRLVTLAEMKNCASEAIDIAAFIFQGAQFTQDFLNGMRRINRGRVFFASADAIGRYVLVDYLSHKTRAV